MLYNTWSPGNYIVETAESTILYFCCPEEMKTISSAGPAVVAWTPSGPNIGFMAPHDETFTIQVSAARGGEGKRGVYFGGVGYTADGAR